MTSFAFILGCVPLWIAAGSGAASRRILGTVVISGMLAATLLAIFLIPMLFVAGRAAGDVGGPRSQAAGVDAGAGAERIMSDTTVRRDRRQRPIAALSAACLVGPNYVKPTLPTPDAIRGASRRAAGPSLADAKWWDVFQDDQLQALVRTALARTTTCASRRRASCEAEAQLGVTRADQYPTRRRRGRRRRAAGRPRSARRRPAPPAAIRVGGTRRWELDFWGRYPARDRGGAGAAAGDRVGTARRA